MAGLRYLGVVAVSLAIYVAYLARQDTPALPTFEEVRTDVYRLNFTFRSPILLKMSVAAWLINTGQNSWVLIDSGSDKPKNIEALVTSLREKLDSTQGSLKLILSELDQAIIVTSQSRHFKASNVLCSHAWTR